MNKETDMSELADFPNNEFDDDFQSSNPEPVHGGPINLVCFDESCLGPVNHIPLPVSDRRLLEPGMVLGNHEHEPDERIDLVDEICALTKNSIVRGECDWDAMLAELRTKLWSMKPPARPPYQIGISNPSL